MEKSAVIDKLGLRTLSEKRKESLITALYVGTVFIILAAVYSLHLSDNIWDRLVDFFTSLTLAPVPATGLVLPAPSDPFNFVSLYTFAFQFALGLGILEIGILFLRVYLHSPVSRKAETIENVVFWLGTSYLISAYLINITIPSEWFVFWAGIIMIFGISLVARAFVLIANR
jgi:hypothetical protein